MKTAVFPGSFDPVTVGHVDVIKRAARLFDRLIVAVSVNTEKKYMFSAAERLEMLRRSLKDLDNVEVSSYTGFTTDYLAAVGASYVVRGLRGASDFEYEKMINSAYKTADPTVETVCLFSDGAKDFVSSTVAREFIIYGKDLDGVMPAAAIEYLKEIR